MTERRAGFTLLELALVLFILAAAFSILLPRLPRPEGPKRDAALRRLAMSAESLYEEAVFKKKAWL